jgi:4-amino-4-deoxy-L-arabinose transferase-like glycosyltransferase
METYALRAGKLVPRTRLRALDWTTTFAPVALITALAAVLRLWAFDRVPGNPFYDAAVRSMSLSWHNFFFGAMEPAGQVSVDKAPADLWLQVVAVKLFGFSGVVVRLPEVLAAIAAIPLLYDLVRRLFGRTAGLGAALTLAVLPAAILTAHSDTMDSLMMLLDVGAAWLVVAGAQRRQLWPVVAAGAVVGLAFNVKLFEAFVVVPALVVLISLAARRRALALGGFAAALAAVGLSWIAIASLTAISHRPWPYGSTDGSIWSVVFGFNGIDRIHGTASAAALKLDPPGVCRFLTAGGHQYLWTVGTALVAAIVLPLVALARGWRPRGVALAGAAFFGVWLVTGVAVLSHMQRMEPRYLETTTPAIAAAVGIGAAKLSRRAAVTAGVLAAALALPAGFAMHVAHQHRSDAGLASRLTPAQLASLSGFLQTHSSGTRYELASSAVFRAAPLIVRDDRPVLMLAAQPGLQLTGPQRLSGLVANGSVRYALLSDRPIPSAQWALRHGRDVSRAAGLPPHTLYRLTATARPPATARSGHPAGRPRG